MSIAISNSSPLIHLAKIRCLEFMPKVFGPVHFPKAVYDEVVVQGEGRQEVEVIRAEISRGMLVLVHLKNRMSQDLAEQSDELGMGEVESIALAMEMHADWLIMDDSAGRA